jgi:acetyltransferase-like isoleucine patch superfamily enzyme
VIGLLRWYRLTTAARAVKGSMDIASSVAIGRGARIEVLHGAHLAVGPDCRIGDGVMIRVRSGTVELAEGVVLEDGCTITALSGASIGARARIGSRAALIDFQEPAAREDTPLRSQAVRSEAIEIGAGSVIGPAAVIGAGARIAAGTVVPAGANVEGAREPPPG